MKELPAAGNITQDFYTEVYYIYGRNYHGALDIVNYDYVPMHALFKGSILLLIDDCPDGAFTSATNTSGYGNEVWVLSENGRVKMRLAHNKQSSPVKKGQKVKKGDVVAYMGQTGFRYSYNGVDPIHTHYEIYVDGVLVDPLSDWEKYLTEKPMEVSREEFEELKSEVEVLKGRYEKTTKNTKRLRKFARAINLKKAKELKITKPKKK